MMAERQLFSSSHSAAMTETLKSMRNCMKAPSISNMATQHAYNLILNLPTQHLHNACDLLTMRDSLDLELRQAWLQGLQN